MCGIAGVIGPAADESGARDSVVRMLEAIRSRGEPELFGEIASFPGAMLGNNRLAIVERSTAAQPIESSDGTVRLVHNGEIYNFERLRRFLRRTADNRGDGGVVGDALAELGTAAVRLLDGEFAFAAQFEDGRFLLARDPLGVKPLYFVRDGDSLWFASEMKCLLSLGAAIEELPPGSCVDDSGVWSYFTLPEPVFEADPIAGALEFAELFEDAVAKRVATDL